MAPTLHSQFSASSAARLLACPGAFEAALSVNTGRKSSVFSAEGTLAHAISEACLLAGTAPVKYLGQTMSADGFEFVVDQEMVDFIDVYVNFLHGLRALGYVIALENRVSPQWCWPDMKLEELDIELFGTADCIAYHPVTGHIIIVDLKFGKGVPVEVNANPQLLYYASGALNPDIIEQLCLSLGQTKPATLTPKSKVDLVVCQPRAYHPQGPVRRAEYTVQEVMDWNALVLHPGVKKAMEDKGRTFKAGKHCRFCPVEAMCPTARQFSLDTAKAMFASAPAENVPMVEEVTKAEEAQVFLAGFDLSDDDLGDLLDRITILGPWIEAVKKYAADRLESGRPVRNWRLVPKAARRHWADADDVTIQNLKAEGLDVSRFTRTELLSPAQVQKELGKKTYDAKVAPYVGKSSSGTTLAPVTDPRTQLQGRTAREAFTINASTTKD